MRMLKIYCFFVALTHRKIKGDQCHLSYCKDILVVIGIILCGACGKSNQSFHYFTLDPYEQCHQNKSN
jgi:hypothetical protein